MVDIDDKSKTLCTPKWDQRYRQLESFHENHAWNHGHTNVPLKYKLNPGLRNWVYIQRHSYRQGELSGDRIARLKLLGFQFKHDCHEEKWEQRFVEYSRLHEHASVPSNCNLNPLIKNWVNNQRESYKYGTLSEDKAARLKLLGFRFHLYETWEQRYLELVTYSKQHGNTKVPYTYHPNPPLGRWVSKQRLGHERGRLSKDRTSKLRKIGFQFRCASDTATNTGNRGSTPSTFS